MVQNGSETELTAPGYAAAPFRPVVGSVRPPSTRFGERRIDAPTITARIIEYERDFPVAGVWESRDVHYFDMSLAPRPSTSRGCFEDVFQELQTYGKIFVVPAGFRLRAEGPPCQQRALNVFLRAHPMFPDEPMESERIEPMLRNCLRMEGVGVRETLERIQREILNPSFGSEILVEGLGLTLLVETARAMRVQLEQSGRKGGLPLWRLRIIEERVRDGGGLPTVGELAELCGLSRRQLTRAFREETGRTIGEYVQEMTLDRAKHLLRDTKISIALIAADVGFANPSAFSNAFRRATGQSPGAYRSARFRM